MHPLGWGSGVLASVSPWPQQHGARGVLPGLCQSRTSSLLITALVEMVGKRAAGELCKPLCRLQCPDSVQVMLSAPLVLSLLFWHLRNDPSLPGNRTAK